MKVFSLADCQNKLCDRSEVGTPWQDRWSLFDVLDGTVDATMVGKAKAPQQSAPGGSDDPNETYLPGGTYEKEIALYHANPTEYKARNSPAAFTKLMATDEARRAETAAKPPEPAWERITTADAAKMSISEMRRMMAFLVDRKVPEGSREEFWQEFRQFVA